MTPLPPSIIGLIEYLEVQYPARCIAPDEPLESHLRYAGKVQLITELRDRYAAEIRKERGSLPNVF